MATITGLTDDYMKSIAIVSGSVNGLGHLILETIDGTTIDAGYVVGPTGSGAPDATETVKGIMELASATDIAAGTDTTKAVTPAGLTLIAGQGTGYRYWQTLVITSSGSFTKATYPTLRAVRVRVVGGGGSGGGSAAATTGGNHSAGGGGGGGGYAEAWILAASITATETITVGAAGASNSGAAGGAGGTSSFGTQVVASGGAGGTTMAQTAVMVGAVGGAGGIGTAGDVLGSGAPGVMGSGNSTLGQGGSGGSSMLGGGGIGTYEGATNGNAAGVAGALYGGGGGGAQTNSGGAAAAGGAGAKGIVIIDIYV